MLLSNLLTRHCVDSCDPRRRRSHRRFQTHQRQRYNEDDGDEPGESGDDSDDDDDDDSDAFVNSDIERRAVDNKRDREGKRESSPSYYSSSFLALGIAFLLFRRWEQRGN